MRFKELLFPFLFLFLSITMHAQVYRAHLSGHQEVYPAATAASGEITATLSGDVLAISGEFQNLTGAFDPTIAGGSHIHIGYAGENGGIALTLVPILDADLRGGSYVALSNTFTLTVEQLAALAGRQMYINIHSTAFPGGELRGQLLPDADEYFNASLFGSNEAPAVVSTGQGALAMELSGNELTVTGSFSGLMGDFNANIAGGSHLHMGIAGSNGGILIGLNVTLDEDARGGIYTAAENTFILTEAQIDALNSRMVYANIHTTAVGSGELRGQAVPAATSTLFRAHLSGNQEVPVVSTLANGMVFAELIDTTLVVTGSFSGLTGVVAVEIAGGAHIHSAPAGQNGGIAVILNPTLDADMVGGQFLAADNTFELTTEQAAALYARGAYINIHSEAFMGGELRGQLLPESQQVFNAYLAGALAQPDVATSATGMIMAEVSGNRLICSGSYNGLESMLNVDIAGGIHLHTGLPGQNGDVAFVLVPEPNLEMTSGVLAPALNTFELTTENQADFRARGFYVNVHSLDAPSGEIRGNMLGEAAAYFYAPLSGASEPNGINTPATGMLALEVNSSAATAVGAFGNLSSPVATEIAGGAHIHGQFAGSNGGVVFLLNSTLEADMQSGVFAAADNRIEMTTGQLDTLRGRMFYVNIHTTENMGGELRGQCLPAAQNFFHTTLSGLHETNPVETEAMGSLKLELNGNTLVATGSFSQLSGNFDAEIAGGSHLHLGVPGVNGDIGFTLSAELAEDLRSGFYTAAANTFEVTAEEAANLRAGDYYVNIHTMAVASGELRGQALPEINLFPEATTIELPLPGAMLDISGAGDTELAISWLPATDPDGDDLNYIWQLALDAEFESIIFMQSTSSILGTTLLYSDVDALLDANGVMVGGEVTLYHRVIASDGSNFTPGSAREAQFTRGTVTGLDNELRQLVSMKAFPTLINADREVRVELSTDQSRDAILQITNALGQPLQQYSLRGIINGQTTMLNFNTYPQGTYYLTLLINDQIVDTQRIIKQ